MIDSGSFSSGYEISGLSSCAAAGRGRDASVLACGSSRSVKRWANQSVCSVDCPRTANRCFGKCPGWSRGLRIAEGCASRAGLGQLFDAARMGNVPVFTEPLAAVPRLELCAPHSCTLKSKLRPDGELQISLRSCGAVLGRTPGLSVQSGFDSVSDHVVFAAICCESRPNVVHVPRVRRLGLLASHWKFGAHHKHT